MRPADTARLVLLAAIWGASFIFMRVAAPVLGPVWTAQLRVLLGGLALLGWFRVIGFDAALGRHWRFYLLIGTVNSAIPFALYAYAAERAPASVLAILNATAPMFSLVFGALFARERVTLLRLSGLLLGALGVALIVAPASHAIAPVPPTSVAAALLACCGYAAAGMLIRRHGAGVPPRGLAAGNQLAAALVLLPLLPVVPPHAAPTPLVVANLAGLALLASAAAFLLYFRLIADVGATRALTVTFLIPLFGVLWGVLFLGETLPPAALTGGALVVLGTVFVVRG